MTDRYGSAAQEASASADANNAKAAIAIWISTRLKDPGFPVASPPSGLLSELPGRPSRFLPGGAPRSGRGGPSRRREATRKDRQATGKRPASDPQGLPGFSPLKPLIRLLYTLPPESERLF